MVFSSLPFILLFLPITVILYYLLQNRHVKYALPFLLLSSLFFYSYWKPSYLLVILFSIVFNYLVGQAISKKNTHKKTIFIFGISVNLLLLGYFKYTNFLLTTIYDIIQLEQFSAPDIILPIGISFYTFQQIAYLSDIYTEKFTPCKNRFFEYASFVCFFPQLIAGPIVHHAEMMPQFFNKKNQTVQWDNMYKGLYFFSIGLAKKVLIADSLSPIVQYCFDKADSLTFLEALFGSTAYTLQLYFDFSGYADMAIGCALFFNIQLPFNFNSPYKALNIQDFWRRWHITLSRWLRDYLYIPLGGNKGSVARVMSNLFLTFLLGGIWHGAGWTFVLWGTLHGIALILHRIWSHILGYKMPNICAWVFTFLFVSLTWIPFRAANFEKVYIFVEGFFGNNGFLIRENFSSIASNAWTETFLIQGGALEYSIAMLLLIIGTVTLKNSQDSVIYLKHAIFRLYFTIILGFSLYFLLLPGYLPEFIYFQF